MTTLLHQNCFIILFLAKTLETVIQHHHHHTSLQKQGHHFPLYTHHPLSPQPPAHLGLHLGNLLTLPLAIIPPLKVNKQGHHFLLIAHHPLSSHPHHPLSSHPPAHLGLHLGNLLTIIPPLLKVLVVLLKKEKIHQRKSQKKHLGLHVGNLTFPLEIIPPLMKVLAGLLKKDLISFG